MKNEENYKIEAGELFNELKSLLGKKHPFLEIYNSVLKNIPYLPYEYKEDYFLRNKPLVIEWYFENFEIILSYKLVVIPIEKIPLYLDYYIGFCSPFSIGKSEFVDNVNYIVLKLVKIFKNYNINVEEKVQTIESWAIKMRKDIENSINIFGDEYYGEFDDYFDYTLNIREIYNKLKDIPNLDDIFLDFYNYSVRLIPEFNKKQKDNYFSNGLTLIVKKDMVSYPRFLAYKILVSPYEKITQIMTYHYKHYSVEYKKSNYIENVIYSVKVEIMQNYKLEKSKKDYIINIIDQWKEKHEKENTFEYIDDKIIDVNEKKIDKEYLDKEYFEEEIFFHDISQKKSQDEDVFDEEEYFANNYFKKEEKKVKNIEFSNNYDIENYENYMNYEIELGQLYIDFTEKYGNFGSDFEYFEDFLIDCSTILDNRDIYETKNIDLILNRYIVYHYHYAYEEAFFFKLKVLNIKEVDFFLDYHLCKYHKNNEKNFLKFISEYILSDIRRNKKLRNKISKWLLKKQENYDIFSNDEINLNLKLEILIYIFNALKDDFVKGKKILEINSNTAKYISKKILYFNNQEIEFIDYNKQYVWSDNVKDLAYLFYLLQEKEIIKKDFDIPNLIISTFINKDIEFKKKSIKRYLQNFNSFSTKEKPKKATFYDNIVSNALNNSK